MLKFSFLIALYNGEQYLTKLLDSLLVQDIPYDEYEIICLDDCSPDNSSDVVRTYQKKYLNIRLYKNETNCKIATNVNKLIDWANGKYFWTLGQDDYIEPNCLNRVWRKLESDNLDVLVFNYRRVNQFCKTLEEIHEVENTKVMLGTRWIEHQYTEKNRDYCYYILGYEWRAIFRTKHWKQNNIRCVDGLSWEDTVIMMKAIVYAKNVASIDDILYNYRKHVASISSNSNHIKRGDYIFEFSFQVGDEVERFYYELIELAPDLATNMYKQIIWRYNYFAFDLVCTTQEQKKKFYERYSQYKELVKQKRNWLNWRSKILLIPYVGYYVACLCEIIYRTKKLIFK
ncbi:MAG: glycosyltransferase [Paludibacteraceae bacterium]|nr:glycosyltransferase [Paludibacteraceae bacterium]